MYLKIEMNEQEEIDLDFKGSNQQALLMLVTAMDASPEIAKLFKKAVDAYDSVNE